MPLPFRYLLAVLALAGAALVASPALAAEQYYPLTVTESGAVDASSLDRAVDRLRAELEDRPSEIVVLVHGYNTSVQWGTRQYEHIARDLHKEAEKAGLRVGVVGVHWPSYPGPAWSWLPKVVGYRAVAELGFRNALQNPYYERVLMARKTGRVALRTALFRFQDGFKQAHLHLLAHSLGSEVALRALAPEERADEKPQTVYERSRKLEVALVTLAGADLDEDVFSSRKEPSAPEALSRAGLWWVTVPQRGSADAVLELRHGAGRRDAVGNRGMTLYRSDLNPLLARVGLVIDNQQVPITHAIEDYYAPERLRDTLGAMAFLRDPNLPAAKASLPALLQPNAPSQPPSALAAASLKVYGLWRSDPKAKSFGLVRVSKDKPPVETSTRGSHPTKLVALRISSTAAF